MSPTPAVPAGGPRAENAVPAASSATGPTVTLPPPPPVEPLFATWWPAPASSPRWVIAVAALVGLVAALLVPDAPRPGINLLICGSAAALPVGVLAYQRGLRSGKRWPVGRVSLALAAVALGLAGVAAVRSSEWLAWGSAAAALCLGAAVALDLRRWPAVLATVPLFAVAVLRALPWARRGVQGSALRPPPRPWLVGLAVGGACTVVVAGLLASADQAFADVLGALRPTVEVGLLPARVLVFLAAAGIVLGGLFAVSTRLTPPRPSTKASSTETPSTGSASTDKTSTEDTFTEIPSTGIPSTGAPVGRHPAEWLVPLVLVALTIAAFLTVEAATLFGGADVVRQPGTVSHADRAREGFGQLTVVTLIVLGLLSWAGRAASAGPATHRRLMGAGGGVLLLLALLLGTSALRRLWLYQDEYGWTVTRLNAGAFELWVAVVLLGVAVAWLLRRTDLVPRFLIGSAGFGLLVMGMAGPDALVAEANVERYRAGHQIDTYYLSGLSADAVPALYRLPEPLRACTLAGRTAAADPWFGWNLSRSRADALLRAQPPGECLDVPDSTTRQD